MKCEKCGAELDKGASFCRECGEKVVAKKIFCRYCGSELAQGVKFCFNCGESLDYIDNSQKSTPKTSVETSENTTEKSFQQEVHDTIKETIKETVHDSVEKSVQQSINRSENRTNNSSSYNSNAQTYSNSQSSRNYQNVNSSANVGYGGMGNSVNKSKNNNVFYALIGGIAVVFIIVILAIVGLVSKFTGAKEEARDLAIPTACTSSEDKTISLDYTYAYMCDEWNVYIAVPISETAIKIENWDKTLSSTKKMSYSSDIGTYKLDDPDNGFYWVDDEHTAFVINFQDKNNSEVRKNAPHVFTINLSDSDENKGTDYNESIACCSFQNDDWHMYRAIALTDELIKIECWSRSSSLDKFLFGYDVCVININDDNYDFEWSDDRHSACTVTMIDPDNSSYWKEEKFVGFTLENSGYTYKSVADYLGLKSVSNSASSAEKVSKDAFDSSEKVEYTMGNYTFTIPTYWVADVEHGDTYRAYAETGNAVAMLMITRSYDDADPVTYDILVEDTENGLMSASVQSAWDNPGDVTIEEYSNGELKGYIYSLDFVQDDGMSGHSVTFCFPSVEDNNWFYVYLVESDNTEYNYYSDFIRMLDSIVKTTESSEVSSEDSEEVVEETEEVEEVEEESVKYDEIVLPETGTKLARDFDSKGTSTVYYINVDGTSNKPTLKTWGGKTVTDGIAEYLDYLEDLGFTVKITSYDKSTPYAGFTLYEADFEVSNEYVSWTMYMCIEDEDFTEYEFDIHLD